MTLAPISLDELNATASLLRRTDRKYALRRADADQLATTAPLGTRVLTIDGCDRFTYDSVYFDTTAFHSYRDAAHARAHRFKIRTRHYVDSDLAFLEVKTRERGTTVKRRIPHDPAALFHLNNSAQQFIGQCLVAGRITELNPSWLRPTLITSYTRSTYLPPGETARITVDDNLRWRSAAGPTLSAPELVVIETKTTGRASSADRQLWADGHRPTRLSKYATGLAALHPELPANRWHRTLTTHFAA